MQLMIKQQTGKKYDQRPSK